MDFLRHIRFRTLHGVQASLVRFRRAVPDVAGGGFCGYSAGILELSFDMPMFLDE